MLRHGYRGAQVACAPPRTRGLEAVTVTWLFGLLLATLCVVLPSSAAHSATYYVTTSGNDGAAGSQSAPWRTITHAISIVGPGDTVMIGDGTYSESMKIDEMKQGGSPVTFQAVNSRKAILSPGGANGIYADYTQVQNVRFVGLKVQNGRCGVEFSTGGNGIEFADCEFTGFIEGIRIRAGSNVKISDCYVHNNQNGVLLGVKDVSGIQNILVERTISANNQNGGNQDGFMVEGLCQNLVFRDCVAYGASDTGFDCKPDNTIIERCLSYNNQGWGMKLWGNGSKVINSIVYGNQIDGIGCSGSNLSFIGCTIGPNSNDGLRLETSSISTCVVRNTIFYNSPLHCFANGLPQEDYNCYYASGSGYVIQTGSVGYSASQVNSHPSGVGSHDIGRDPLFVSASTANFKLASGSPCIGAGVADSSMTLDYYGKTRLSPPDIGAIASNTGTGTITPTAPTVVTISNGSTAGTDADLIAVAAGSTASSGTVTYAYQWAKSTDNGTSWSAWGWPDATLSSTALAVGQMWKARARATVDNTNYSNWTESSICTISGNSGTVAAPTAVTVSPSAPADTDNLTVTATGGGNSGTAPSYEYQWARSTDGGSTWAAWGNSGSVLLASSTSPGDAWKARARVVAGADYSSWVESAAVTVAGGSTGTLAPPRLVQVSPTAPTDSSDLQGVAFGGGNGDSSDTYQFQWARSTDGGSTWAAWGNPGSRLSNTLTAPGDTWKTRGRVTHLNTTFSTWTESAPVTIPGGSKVVAPSSVVVTPSNPLDGTKLTATASPALTTGVYQYQWRRSANGGSTWSSWGYTGRTLSASYTRVGDLWQARARAKVGTTYSAWKVGDTVTIGTGTSGGATTGGVKVAITPSSPTDGSTLTAQASGTYSNGLPLEFEYYWSRSTDGGATWEGWNYYGQTLSADETRPGDKWRVEAKGHDGTSWGAFVVSAPVTIQ